jgi:hypothetical protein
VPAAAWRKGNPTLKIAKREVCAAKNRFPQTQNRFVRTISISVLQKIVSCGHLTLRAGKIPSVRTIGRFVRANYRFVRA